MATNVVVVVEADQLQHQVSSEHRRLQTFAEYVFNEICTLRTRCLACLD